MCKQSDLAGFSKARHLAGGLQTCMEKKHYVLGLERNRNCEY